MRKIVLISHGKFADGILDTISMFLGEHHNFVPISAYTDEVNPQEELKKFFDDVKEDEEVIICSDILGGSVCQYTLPYMKYENVFLIAGFNFPLLLELAVIPDDEKLSYEVLDNKIQKAKESIILMNTYDFTSDFDE